MTRPRVRSYRLALPPPWERISLRKGTQERVQQIVDDVAAAYTPKEVPPDQVGPKKRELVRAMMLQVKRAQDTGGVDLYLPLSDIHGFTVQASFVVSEVTPDANTTADEVPQVLASMLRDSAARPLTIDDTVWVRRQAMVPARDDQSAPSTRVEYFTSVPGASRYWILSSFSKVGPPITEPDDPEDKDDLLVSLFDAIMTTWRWQYDEPAEAGTFVPEHTTELLQTRPSADRNPGG